MKRDRRIGTGSYKVKKRPYKVKNTLNTKENKKQRVKGKETKIKIRMKEERLWRKAQVG